MVGDISNVFILTGVMVLGWHREGMDMKRVHGVMKIVRVLALIGVFSLWAASQSKGMALNLIETPGGANFAIPLTVSYSGQTFQLTSQPPGPENAIASYNYNNQPENDFYSDFTLTATITSAGALISGSFTINGDMGSGPELLLSGQLHPGADGVTFGSNVTGDPNATLFEFPFTVNGGDPTIMANFGWPDASMQGSVEVTAYFAPGVGDTAFTGAWTGGNFDNNESAGNGSVADIAVVPEPSSIMLVLVGCMVFLGAHRATANKRGCV